MSDSFTIEDIHRIREEDYEETKTLTYRELMAKTKADAAPAWKRFFEMGGVLIRHETAPPPRQQLS